MAGSQNGTVFRTGTGSHEPPASASVDALANLVYSLVLLVMMTMIGLFGSNSCNPKPPTQQPADPNSQPAPPVTANFKYYTVQVDRFEKIETANSFSNDLRSQNIKNFVLQTDQQWLVCVGRYVSRQRAENMRKTLQKSGFRDLKILEPPEKKNVNKPL